MIFLRGTMKQLANKICFYIAYALCLSVMVSSAWATNIIVVTHGQASDPFWTVLKNGVDKAAEDTGSTAFYRAPETFDMVAMGQLIDAAINQEPDGLVVSIPDVDALRPSITRAVEAGIPVISMNSGSDVYKDLGIKIHVGQEEYEAGEIAGKELTIKGNVGLCVNHEVGNVALDLRCEGFKKGFGDQMSILVTGNDPAEIKAKVKAALTANPEIDTVLALGASLSGEAVVAAAMDLNSDVQIASFDLSPNFLQFVADGKASFAIDQQQFLQGYLPVLFLAHNHQYGLFPGSSVRSGPNLVTADKAKQAIELSAKGIR